MQLDPTTTAVVITDPQLDVLAPDGAFADLVGSEVSRLDVVRHLRALRDAAEAAGVPVIYSPLLYGPGDLERGNAPIFSLIAERRAMRAGSGGEFHPDLVPTEKTIVAAARKGMAAFGTTDLEEHLRSRGVRTVIMAGMIADLCLESNVRGAIEAGFEVVVARDATATVSADAYEAALASFGLLAKATPSTAEIVGSLSTAAAA